MEKYHPIYHKLKFFIGYSVAVVVIVVALGVSGLRFLLTTANLYQAEVEELASSLLEQPVKIGKMDAKLSGLVPTLIFHDVQLISEQTKKSLLELTRIDIGLSFDSLLFQQKIIPTQLTIRGMNLQVRRTVDGSFKIKGVDLKGLTSSVSADDTSNTILNRLLLQKSEIGLEDSAIIWTDDQNAGLTWFFSDVNFLLKNSGERHQLSLSSNLPKVLGKKIKLAFDFEGDIADPKSWQVKSFIESKGFNIKPIEKYIKNKYLRLNEGIVDLTLWADWGNENIKQLSGNVKLHDFSYRLKRKKLVKLKYISGVFDSLRDENDDWNVTVEKFNYQGKKKSWPESEFSVAFNKGHEEKIFYVKADYLRLGELADIITDNNLVNLKNLKNISDLNIKGNVNDFFIAWRGDEIHQLKADFSGLGMNSWEQIPEIKDLSGNIEINQQKGHVSLLSQNTIIGLPYLFRKSFKFNTLVADIDFSKTTKGLLFDVNHLTTQNTEITAITKAKLWLPKNKSSPHLDLQTYVSRGDASKTSHFLPVSIMEKSLVKWIDEGILGGDVNNGTVIFNGKLNNFPFDKNEGVFAVDVDVSKFALNYQNGWPKIEDSNVTATFTGQGMELNLATGKVEKNIIYDSRAKIASFSAAELQLNISANGSTHNAMQFMVNSPILPEAKSPISTMRLLGDTNVTVDMNIPLDEKISKKKSLSYTGSAELRSASFLMLKDKLDITDISGNITFSDKMISGKDLLANIVGEKAKLSIKSLPNNKGLEIGAIGRIKPGLIFQRFEIPGFKQITGDTSFNGNIIFPDENSKYKYPVLNITSDLAGVKSSFPEFFYKKRKTQERFKFVTAFTEKNKTELGFYFGKKGSAIIELDQSNGVTYLNKGSISLSSTKAILPKKNILYIDGSIKNITPSKWIHALDLKNGKKPQTFFVNPVVLNLDKLNMFTVLDDEQEDKAIISPTNLPLFEGIIKKLSFDEVFLGRLDFKTSAKKYGLHLDELILSAQNMKLFANGDWQFKRGKHKTKMDITLSSNNFGSMLTDLGFAAIINQGIAQTVGKINWQGAPTQFALYKLNGNIQLNIKDGSIIEVDAGTGRLLGLFSLSALPRKLFGDFKDTFKSGFSFDHARGNIKIEDGDAYTDNFEVKSSVAEITVSGRTGLEARDYENIVEVVPDVGGGIAGVTALLVNLPAGIGLWLVDKITGEQFNEASTRSYEITGSWEVPEIELIDEE